MKSIVLTGWTQNAKSPRFCKIWFPNIDRENQQTKLHKFYQFRGHFLHIIAMIRYDETVLWCPVTGMPCKSKVQVIISFLRDGDLTHQCQGYTINSAFPTYSTKVLKFFLCLWFSNRCSISFYQPVTSISIESRIIMWLMWF